MPPPSPPVPNLLDAATAADCVSPAAGEGGRHVTGEDGSPVLLASHATASLLVALLAPSRGSTDEEESSVPQTSGCRDEDQPPTGDKQRGSPLQSFLTAPRNSAWSDNATRSRAATLAGGDDVRGIDNAPRPLLVREQRHLPAATAYTERCYVSPQPTIAPSGCGATSHLLLNYYSDSISCQFDTWDESNCFRFQYPVTNCDESNCVDAAQSTKCR